MGRATITDRGRMGMRLAGWARQGPLSLGRHAPGIERRLADQRMAGYVPDAQHQGRRLAYDCTRAYLSTQRLWSVADGRKCLGVVRRRVQPARLPATGGEQATGVQSARINRNQQQSLARGLVSLP